MSTLGLVTTCQCITDTAFFPDPLRRTPTNSKLMTSKKNSSNAIWLPTTWPLQKVVLGVPPLALLQQQVLHSPSEGKAGRKQETSKGRR